MSTNMIYRLFKKLLINGMLIPPGIIYVVNFLALFGDIIAVIIHYPIINYFYLLLKNNEKRINNH